MFALILVVMGIWALWGLGLDLFPDIEFPMVTVTTVYPGAGSEEVEKNVTEPLEGYVGTVSNLKKVRSVSRENLSMLILEFEWGTNIDFAAQDVRASLDEALDFLPEDARRPFVSKFDIGQMPVMTIPITGMDDTRALRQLVEDQIAAPLKRIDGVASILVFGGDEREVQVFLDGLKMRELGISPSDVQNAIMVQNINMPAGLINIGEEEYLLRTIGEFGSVEEVGEIVVGATQFGQPIHLAEIADVRDAIKETRSFIRGNRKQGVVMIVFKQSNSNSVAVGNRVKKALDALWTDMPDNIEYTFGLDMADSITRVGNATSMNAIIGGVLAVLMIWIFLRNWRPTFAIALAIPLSVVATFIPLRLAGYTLNIMTLGGLALGVGMLVDNAVVVIENIYRNIELGKHRGEASKVGANQVGMAITASTLTTIAVFLPMVFSAGLAGQLTRGLAMTISFALICSLVVSLSIVPMVASLLFRREKTIKKTKLGIFDRVRAKYRKSLEWAIYHKGAMVLILIVVLAVSAGVFTFVGSEFFPKADDDMVTINMRLPVGTRVGVTDEKAMFLEDIVFSIPEVDRAMTMVGSEAQMGFGPKGSNEAMMMVVLDPSRRRKSGEIADEITERFPDFEGVELELTEMNMMSSGEGDIDIKIFGEDNDRLREYSLVIADVTRDIPGFADVRSSVEQGKPEIEIRINKQKASRLGVPTYLLANQIRTLTLGAVATRLRDRAGEETDIRVRLREDERLDIEDIMNMPISTPMGFVPLKEVADFIEAEGPVRIEREMQTRLVHVYGNRRGRDLGSIVKDIEERIAPIVANFEPGYDYEISGEQEQMKDAFQDLAIAMLLAIIVVYAIMAALFESLVQPLVIMVALPLAAIGVVWIFLISGSTLSVVSFVGVIILAGIVVNNGIVLVDHTNQLRRNGLCKEDALVQAGYDRIRPVLITALTTIIGMLPMAIARGDGAELRSPMALTVIGGLISATFLTLYFVPVFYSIADKLSIRAQKNFVALVHGEEEANGLAQTDNSCELAPE
ncbi:MAG TPA: efflux RND transporter permease subunit [candidate division Zixibacteria bacterium]|nr:efflux RND transporter permease subunit [candidate division Zixibacteria bacterium]